MMTQKMAGPSKLPTPEPHYEPGTSENKEYDNIYIYDRPQIMFRYTNAPNNHLHRADDIVPGDQAYRGCCFPR
jgi:hypothetical protein